MSAFGQLTASAGEKRLAKYDPLQEHLERSRAERLSLTFTQIDKLVGGLPLSASEKVEWWANENVRTTRHTQCKSWQAAGYTASIDLRAKTVTFSRR